MGCLIPFMDMQAQNEVQQQIKEAANRLTFRSIGPALMGGRIADIAVSPHDQSTWYVAAGSGNLWKTTNSGVTWTPVFDDQVSYSIGCVTVDPNRPEVVWVGTGENVSGRHVGWGDGVYKSLDGGRTWKNMGLSKSEHIGKILIDPRDSDVVLVAAEGPLWSDGGHRGVYRSTDGGETWSLVLGIDEHTGVTDLEFAPDNPDILFAAAYQRRRHTWSLLAGGPQSGIYKSADNGGSWRQVTAGLPAGDKGKIGLAVTPANPNIVYATIEASSSERGFYRSVDRGEHWEKRNGYISGGTGPHYYQEIEASPVNPDLVYQMDVFLHVTRDGGKTFDYLETGRDKHSDNHALWIDPANGQHLLVGTDAGLFESFDEGTRWRHFPNLPISQFYKLGLDNTEPFYNIVGGAQDLGTLIGPSRTLNAEGIRNRDWYVPLGADGYGSVFDPKDPNIAYMEYQQGYLFRYDRKNHEVINIQPVAGPDEVPERWNWDSPILISPHNHQRIYFGSQRLWKSDNRGDTWEPVSADLTTNTNRYELELMGRVWSTDALYDNGAMSKYATLTAISESPLVEGLLYTGSDDGLIHVSETGGEHWRMAGPLPKVPERSFINHMEASLHDEATVFAVADAHKFGDYSPYLFMSTDRGITWASIAGDLPEGTIVWVIKQDHENENLLFIGTEYGIFFSINRGENWIKLGGGVPTIPFRDLELHTRDHDLVGATFGRGFYVLDDYSALRTLSEAVEQAEATTFPVRDAWWYIPNVPMQAKGMPTLGSDSYVADNPAFGAMITYYLPEVPQTSKAIRQKVEEGLRTDGADIPFPGWEVMRQESTEGAPAVMLLISDQAGNPVRWIQGPARAGLQRVTWDLRLPAPNPVKLSKPAFQPPWAGNPKGPLVAPGTYTVQVYLSYEGALKPQGSPQSFQVKPVPNLSAEYDFQAVAAFQQKTSELMRQISNAGQTMGEASERLRFLKAALPQTPKATTEHFTQWQALHTKLADLRMTLYGDPARSRMNESGRPSIQGRVGQIAGGHWDTRQVPTDTYRTNLRIASEGFAQFRIHLTEYLGDLEAFEKVMDEAGAPYTRGRRF